jgi:hypothetical protein
VILTAENRKIRRKTCSSATRSTANPTLTGLGANPGLHGVRPSLLTPKESAGFNLAAWDNGTAPSHGFPLLTVIPVSRVAQSV